MAFSCVVRSRCYKFRIYLEKKSENKFWALSAVKRNFIWGECSPSMINNLEVTQILFKRNFTWEKREIEKRCEVCNRLKGVHCLGEGNGDKWE